MELRQLHTFSAVAKLGSFTQAADALGYAQSTITTQIQLLEQELEINLFERLNRSISLTPEGKRFLTYTNQILKLCSEAKDSVSCSDQPRGSLTIGAVESLCVIRLPELFKEYHKRYPEVEITLKVGSCPEFYYALRNNLLDIAFILDRKMIISDFITEIEFPEPMAILAAPGHPLFLKPQVYPEDLSEESWILTESGCSYREALQNILSKAGVRPKSVFETGSIQAIKQFSMSGLGITLLPRIAVEDELKRGQLTALNWCGPDFEMMTQLIYHKNKWMSSALKAFLELAREMLPSNK